jgi:hypothetical protein
MSGAIWAVLDQYSYEPVEVIRETEKTVFYFAHGKERRTQSVLPWRGSEEEARKLSQQLASARSERNRRCHEADVWFLNRVKELTAFRQDGAA